MLRSLPYPLLCSVIGLAFSVVPSWIHGPIPAKWDLYYLDGAVMVWGWYLARASIGLLVGLTALPRQWWLRGPLCGALMMMPVGVVSLGNPSCGPP